MLSEKSESKKKLDTIKSIIDSSDNIEEIKNDLKIFIEEVLNNENKCSNCKAKNKLLKEVSESAFIDPVTKLPNFSAFKNDINENKTNTVAIILKINNFSDNNIYYWIDWWNSILYKIWKKLKDIFIDFWFEIYRINGTNFWLQKKCTKNKIDRLAFLKLISEKISKISIDTNFWNLKLKISWWIACSNDYINNDNLITNSYNALYINKNSWTLNIFDKKKEKVQIDKILNIIKWINKIQEWIEKNFFIPYYQWIYDIKNEKIDKHEALIRYDDWNEIYSPNYFLDIAKDNNFLKDLSKIMIKNVIFEMREHNYNISINLTEEDFLNNKLIILIIDTLKNYSINPSRLIIEVLENITADTSKIIENIDKLKQSWVKISIDDFWTGYSNFERLSNIKPDFLKIDWSLIKWILWKNSDKKISTLRAIIDFWHRHWAKIIAEYVENEKIYDIIKILWVDYAQWYYFSKPSRDIIKN